MFKWENLPESINENFLNTTLALDGLIAWFKQDDKLYAMNCGFGGEPNEYYVPTKVIIANPLLGSRELTNGEEAIVMFNSSTDQYCPTGLYALISQYATLMADNIVSINTAQINSRVNTLFVADSIALKNSAEITLKNLYAGKPYSVVEQDIVDNIHANPLAAKDSTNTITGLVELNNYILANFYKSIGIFANNVMKKERLVTDEINSQEAQTTFNIYDMLKQRVAAIEKINSLFGTDIKVYLNPIIDLNLKTNTSNQEEVQEVQDALEPEDAAALQEPIQEEEKEIEKETEKEVTEDESIST